MARIDGEYVINPTFEQLEKADMDLMVGATEENIMMVEGEMDEVPESALLEALKAAHEAIKPMCRLQKELSKELGTDVKREYCHEVNDEELRQQVKDTCYQPCYEVPKKGLEKSTRTDGFEAIREKLKETYAAAHADLTPEELEAELKAIIAETGATSPKDMGKVMGAASKKLAGRADGKAIADTVKRLLAN